MAKVSLLALLFLLPACVQAGVVYVHNSTHRSLLITYQVCYDETHCSPPSEFTLGPNKQVGINITPNTYFSVLNAVSDGPDVDAWKGTWSSGFVTGKCTAQPASAVSVVGNKITFHNFGGSPQLICTVSST